MIEPEWTALGNRVGYSTLYRCLNTSTGIYRDNVTSCGGGNTSYQIGWVLSEPNIHTVPLVRYINGSDYLTLADRTSIPTGYVQDVVLGYVLRAVGHIEDRVYLDNGIINVTVDKKFGGAIIEMTRNGINFVNRSEERRQIQQSFYEQNGTYTEGVYNFGWNALQAGAAYKKPSPRVYIYATTSTN